jgi:hypothetical protein
MLLSMNLIFGAVLFVLLLLPAKHLPSTSVSQTIPISFLPVCNTDHIPYPYKTIAVIAVYFILLYVLRWDTERQSVLNWMVESLPEFNLLL